MTSAHMWQKPNPACALKLDPFLASDQPVLRITDFYRVDRQFRPIRLRETTEGVACLRRGMKAERESGIWLTSQRARRTIRL